VQLTARQKIFLAVAFLLLGGLGAGFFKFFWPQLKLYQDTMLDVQAKERQFEGIQAKFGYYTNPVKYLDDLEPELVKWEDAYKRRAKVFTATLAKVPPAEKEPGFYFNEEWKATRDRLLKKAEQRNVAIPPDIGFGPGIPPRENVPTLLNQLSCTEYVLGLALDHGALAITSFGVGQPQTTSGFINLIPFQLGFIASLEDVKRFLHRCGNGPQYVSVDSLSLRALRDVPGVTNFEVQVSLTTTWILDKPAVTISEEEGLLGEGGLGGFGALMRRMKAPGAAGPDAFPGLKSKRPGG